ncbi:MAG TPA: ABC transporter ATP-binding protein [Ktedonobacterales bacterium]
MDAVVTCENLVKIYKVLEADVEVVALQGLDLEVHPGELVAIVGQSGSGKTTLLNILGALDLPSAGRCSVAGRNLTRLSERQLNDYRRSAVGHVWQQSGRNLVPELSLDENVRLPQMLAGVGGRERAARSQKLLELVGLSERASHRPAQLSGGEQQRGAIAVALANNPAVLLADEPTGELDSATAHEVVALLHRLTRELRLAVILVTHDQAVAAAADRTLAIRDGRTSTETVRRERPIDSMDAASAMNSAPGSADGGSTIVGLPAHTHRESVLVDRAGWLQLPEAAITRIAFAGRAEVRVTRDHVELWPVGTAAAHPEAASAIIGLPSDMYREAVVIDRVGRFQFSEEALDRVPFGKHADVRIADDHVELWPISG